ncbi:hypothetical protein BD626DRAFT_511243 [Schizophyllum amplum]|uniref:ABM domain-containing protein n=1 Tax=Schizophyllum amplum TaxID=97359 RepID=A0A550C167_9AGAR|nr:hypothetical protein BD626DRAFT_511243 [Auriculariopsis ampla]
MSLEPVSQMPILELIITSGFGEQAAQQGKDGLSSVEGLTSVYVGKTATDSSVGYWLLQWQTSAARDAFTTSPAYATFQQHAGNSTPVLYDLSTQDVSDLEHVLAAPVQEFCVASAKSADVVDKFKETIKLALEITKAIEDTRGAVYSPGVGGEAKGLLLVGWASVEAHASLYSRPEAQETIKKIIALDAMAAEAKDVLRVL